MKAVILAAHAEAANAALNTKCCHGVPLEAHRTHALAGPTTGAFAWRRAGWAAA